MELEEKRNRTLSKKAVIDTYESMAAALVSLFNARLRQELPARLNLPPDKIVLIDAFIGELFAVIQKPLNQWSK
jgi:hypothetical protein